MIRSSERTDAALSIVVVGDGEDSPLVRQLAPYLDERDVELVIHDGDGEGRLLEQRFDLLLLDASSEGALAAFEKVKGALRKGESTPAVLLASPGRQSEFVGELLSCAAHRLRASGGGRPNLGDITPRQKEILRLVARSYTSREIGAQLDISPRTVETHRANMMQRLGIHDVAGLVRFAISQGLVEPEV